MLFSHLVGLLVRVFVWATVQRYFTEFVALGKSHENFWVFYYYISYYYLHRLYVFTLLILHSSSSSLNLLSVVDSKALIRDSTSSSYEVSNLLSKQDFSTGGSNGSLWVVLLVAVVITKARIICKMRLLIFRYILLKRYNYLFYFLLSINYCNNNNFHYIKDILYNQIMTQIPPFWKLILLIPYMYCYSNNIFSFW